MKNEEITQDGLLKLQQEDSKLQLIDVRTPSEHRHHNIGGLLIPLSEILSRVDEISRDKKVIIYCRSGARSAVAIENLEQKFGFDNLYNLAGGIG